jgi:hypothetical protein
MAKLISLRSKFFERALKKLLASLVLTQRRKVTANQITNVQREGDMTGLLSCLAVDLSSYSENCATVDLQFPQFGRLKPVSRLHPGIEFFLICGCVAESCLSGGTRHSTDNYRQEAFELRLWEMLAANQLI